MTRGAWIFLAVLVIGLGLVGAGALMWGMTSGPTVPDRLSEPRPEAAGESEEAGRGQRRRATEQEISGARRALGSKGIIALSIGRFRLRMGRYPSSLNELVNRPETLDPNERWNGPYINNPRLLQDPWGEPYDYQAPGLHNVGAYDLWTRGPDGQDGTADDIGNW